MRSKGRIVLAVFVAVIASSAVVAGAAQAEPTYHHEGAAITKAFNVRYSSGKWTRMWVTSDLAMIRCENVSGTGTITTKGEGTAELAYTGCKIVEAKENATTKQWEEGEIFTTCSVKSAGAEAGELKVKSLKSKLVYRPGNETELLALLEAETQPWVATEITGASCSLKGTVKIEGAVLSSVVANEEAIKGSTPFETTNKGTIKQRFRKYELNGAEAEAELTFNAKSMPYESTEQVELEPVGGLRGLFGAHL
jgi:hypothetical protein